MSEPKLDDPGNLSMLELFRVEAENQGVILTDGLLELERSQTTPGQLEVLMRAAHSLKGAARIVNLPAAVSIAHAMEDCFALAQHGNLALRQEEIDLLFLGVDLLSQLSKHTEADLAHWETEHAGEIRQFLSSLAGLTRVGESSSPDNSGFETLTRPAVPVNPIATDQPQECARQVSSARRQVPSNHCGRREY